VKNGYVDAPYDKTKTLFSYQTIEGIDKILTQMDGRTKTNQNALCSEELIYTEFEEDFTKFFEEFESTC
jgi:hypothetical protein